MTCRAEYLATSLSRLKPWLAEGISRAQWYRRRHETGAARETSAPSPRPKAFVTPLTLVLSPAQLEAARARVAKLQAEMAAENERRMVDWRDLPLPDWRAGRLEIRSILTGETTTIELGASR